MYSIFFVTTERFCFRHAHEISSYLFRNQMMMIRSYRLNKTFSWFEWLCPLRREMACFPRADFCRVVANEATPPHGGAAQPTVCFCTTFSLYLPIEDLQILHLAVNSSNPSLKPHQLSICLSPTSYQSLV
jgi:hypothetical protein